MWSSARVWAFFWLFAVFLAENTLRFIFQDSVPPLLISGVLFYAFLEGPLFGLVAGCYAGFFQDVFGVGKIGYEMAVFGGIGCLAGLAASQIFREGVVTECVLPVLGAYVAVVLNLFIFKTALGGDAPTFGVFQEAFAWRQLLLMALISPLVFKFLRKVSPRARRKKAVTW